MSHCKATNRRRGFTAIELSAVATIIAILALILIPIMRKRVEEAKITAAQADMRQIETSQMMIHADTAFYVRLFDMTRPQPETDDTAAVIQAKLPKASWNIPRDTSMLNTFRNNWRGPYAAPHRQRSLYEIVRGYPQMFRGDNVLGLTPQQGPVIVLNADNTDEQGVNALMRLQYPTDPWGNPYIFFGNGKIGTYGYETAIQTQNETNFNTAVIYCTGPNGTPGNLLNPDSGAYFRESGIIGTEDDLSFQF
ncbi:prepilin-type N-terminal cleavage/methylation domain-containing protein [bacterium]|nr:prepilin-type N-terminal cleavage/methylation domain-containing protein [bacterium]